MARFIVFITLCAGVVGLSGCAKLEDRARAYLASTVDVFAVVGGELLQGEAKLYGDRTGIITMSSGSAGAPGTSCSGSMTRSGTASAHMDIRCADGTALSLSTVLLAETQGYAYGQATTGQPVSLTLGLDPSRAVPYLRVAPGQQLITSAKKPFLVLKP